MARAGRKLKKRERTLGQAIVLGLAVTLGVACAIFVILMLLPGTALPNFYALVEHASSPTIRTDPLFQQWAETIQREEAVVTPLSLFCGGLTLGRLAPRYATIKRVLLSGMAMALGLLTVSLLFEWTDAIVQDRLIDRRLGGYFNPLTIPPDVIVRQIAWVLVWTAVCVLGTWLGLRWRDRKPAGQTAALRPTRR